MGRNAHENAGGNNEEGNKRDEETTDLSEAHCRDAIFHFCDSSVTVTIIESLM